MYRDTVKDIRGIKTGETDQAVKIAMAEAVSPRGIETDVRLVTRGSLISVLGDRVQNGTLIVPSNSIREITIEPRDD